MRSDVDIEREHLARARHAIEEGRRRLGRQQQATANLRAKNKNTQQAERLVALTEGILAEWERHRALIVQRIRYLEETSTG